jgi:glutathione S-transferase
MELSTCTKRVAVVCNELGVDYEVEHVDPMKGEQKSPDYMTKHPFGVIPALEVCLFVIMINMVS